MADNLLQRIADGRTDLVFDHLAAGLPADATDAGGVSLIKWCAYYGDVSAIRHLLAHGESLDSLGDNLDLNGACFHGHWRLAQFLIEQARVFDRHDAVLIAVNDQEGRIVRVDPVNRGILAQPRFRVRGRLLAEQTPGHQHAAPPARLAQQGQVA